MEEVLFWYHISSCWYAQIFDSHNLLKNYNYSKLSYIDCMWDPIVVHGTSSWAVHKTRTNWSYAQNLPIFQRSVQGHRRKKHYKLIITFWSSRNWFGHCCHVLPSFHLLQCHHCLGNILLNQFLHGSFTLGEL